MPERLRTVIANHIEVRLRQVLAGGVATGMDRQYFDEYAADYHAIKAELAATRAAVAAYEAVYGRPVHEASIGDRCEVCGRTGAPWEQVSHDYGDSDREARVRAACRLCRWEVAYNAALAAPTPAPVEHRVTVETAARNLVFGFADPFAFVDNDLVCLFCRRRAEALPKDGHTDACPWAQLAAVLVEGGG